MEIKDLQPRMGKVEVTGVISKKEDSREISKPNFSGRVCNATLKDASGSVQITLWNEQVAQVQEGDTIKISNGYVGEWQGEMQLSTGKFGAMEVVSKGSGEASAQPTPEASAPEPTPEEKPSFDEESVM